MLATFKARFTHGTIEPLEPVDLPEGKNFRVTVTDEPQTTHLKETGEQPSKWALLAEKIHRESPLRGHSKDLIKLVREFREDFDS